MYYIQIHKDKQCGQCSALNQYDSFLHGNEYIIRCRRCNHEKILATLTTGSTQNAIITYIDGKKPTKEIF